MYFVIFLLSLLSVGEGQKNLNVLDDRAAIVQLFEWKWTDIAQECERYLGPNGYAGVQISAPQEHAQVTSPFRPWWERYQPISYDLNSRSGYETQFTDMVQRCNAVGVRIYVDACINHMAYYCGEGTGGNTCVTGTSYVVPYNSSHFNKNIGKCPTSDGGIGSNPSAIEMRNCDRLALPDLAHSLEYVRERIAEYLNHCIDIGVAGFRVESAKYMWPSDLDIIADSLHDLKSSEFAGGSRAFMAYDVKEVEGEPVTAEEYISIGRVAEYKYGATLSDGIRGKISMSTFSTFGGDEWDMVGDQNALVFVDNHETQRDDAENIVTYREKPLYKMANAFMLAWPYGYPRIMSSYYIQNRDASPPSNGLGDISSPTFASDGSCDNGWVCEHRWRAVRNMVTFRSVAGSEPVINWWDDGSKQIAFGRGNKAFVAINTNRNKKLIERLQTGLPAGDYCNIILGDWSDGSCNGPSITVDEEGFADFSVGNGDEPVAAIHVGAISGTGTLTAGSMILILLCLKLSRSLAD